MDFLSHLVTVYLILYAVNIHSDSMFIVAILGGAFPDFDIFFFPIKERVKVLRHHGIFHTYLFLGVVFIPVSIIIGSVYRMNTITIDYMLLLLGGSVHLLMDGLTDFQIAPFEPFSKIEIGIGIDRAVNVYMLLLSTFFTVTLFIFRAYSINIIYFNLMLYILYSIFVINYGTRVLIYSSLYLKHRTGEMNIAIEPTSSPFRWYVVKWASHKDDYTSILYSIDLLHRTETVIKKTDLSANSINDKKIFYNSIKVIMDHNMFDPGIFPYSVETGIDRISVIWYYPQYHFKRFFMGIEVIFFSNGKNELKELFGSIKNYKTETDGSQTGL